MLPPLGQHQITPVTAGARVEAAPVGGAALPAGEGGGEVVAVAGKHYYYPAHGNIIMDCPKRENVLMDCPQGKMSSWIAQKENASCITEKKNILMDSPKGNILTECPKGNISSWIVQKAKYPYELPKREVHEDIHEDILRG